MSCDYTINTRRCALTVITPSAAMYTGSAVDFLVNCCVAKQEVAEQSSKQLHDILSTLQRGVADGMTVLSCARQGSAG